ncbi:hypothetical protein ACIBO1_07635 [Micromonospora sp. NPDC049903]|uniref:hypothetical protein n=1 Tax=Micromonospora sp. NPDC049903 TaxID=3364276 RepID=UPI00378D85F2
MAISFWLVKIEYERTPSTLAALHKAANKLELVVTEFEREPRPTVLVTRSYQCTYPEEVMSEAGSLIAGMRERVGPHCPPLAVVMHPEHEPEPVPPVMTLSEVGVALKVSRQRAQQLSQQPDFPKPVAKTANGPIYAISDIAQYHRTREHRKGRETKGQLILPKIIEIRR